MSDLLYEQNPLERIADYMQIIAEGSGGSLTTPVPVVEFVDDGNSMVAILPDEIKTSGGEGPCIFKYNDPDRGVMYMGGGFAYSPETGAGFIFFTDINSFGSEVEGIYTSSTVIFFSLLQQRDEDAAGTIDVVPLTPVDGGDNEQTIDWRTGTGPA